MASPALIWRAALLEFLDENHVPGDIIEHKWFLDHFKMEVPETMSKHEWGKWSLKFLSYFMPFREHLLKDHFIDLQSIGGDNFQIIPPEEQTRSAVLELGGNYKRIHRRCSNRLRYVNKDKLTQQQLQENADALAKVAQLKAMAQPIWKVE